jgi:hypothetical protein
MALVAAVPAALAGLANLGASAFGGSVIAVKAAAAALMANGLINGVVATAGGTVVAGSIGTGAFIIAGIAWLARSVIVGTQETAPPVEQQVIAPVEAATSSLLFVLILGLILVVAVQNAFIIYLLYKRNKAEQPNENIPRADLPNRRDLIPNGDAELNND